MPHVFTQITSTTKYPNMEKAKIDELHRKVIDYVCENFEDTNKFKRRVLDVLNAIACHVFDGEPVPNVPLIELTLPSHAQDTLHRFFINERDILWDVEPMIPHATTSTETMEDAIGTQDIVPEIPDTSEPTPKEDLYLAWPEIPRRDCRKIWRQVGDDILYVTLPLVPTRQREISVTTNVGLYTDADLLKLFPNHMIRTRHTMMYEKYDGLEYDEDVGAIIPIEGFTKEQVRDNIIKYPHLYKLYRVNGEKGVPFFAHIEIDGELIPLGEAWHQLPESKIIPNIIEFGKEYVIRRYLLERDILGIEHKYPLDGSLDPWLTLFTTVDQYASWGYTDAVGLARACVECRVKYRQTRNPVIKRMDGNERVFI